MPRLLKYENRDAYYAVTSIDGSVVTYQLTPAGERQLLKAGIVAGEAFDRALLLDLYRTGEAYAPGVEFPEAVWANQLEMDLAGDPSPESAFPVCDGCRSPADLHFTLTPDRAAALHCPRCRAAATTIPAASIPLPLLTRTPLARLAELMPIATRSENVRRYEALQTAAFARHWELHRQHRSGHQPALFGESALGGLGLE